MEIAIVHRVFGALLGVWISYLFTTHFPPFSVWSLVYIILVVIIIGWLAIMLNKAFRSNSRIRRAVDYLLIWLSSILIPLAIFLIGTNSLIFGLTNIPDFLWRLGFVTVVIIGWTIAAEIAIIQIERQGNA